MKILYIHNYYQQAGGEDSVFEHEIRLLKNAGHEVIDYQRTNLEAQQMGMLGKATVPLHMTWAQQAVTELKALILESKPDIAHFHNTHYRISPAGYYACKSLGVPVVQTLHNFRLFCLSANFLRDGHICEDCTGKFVPYPGILRRCYHDSVLLSASVAGMLTVHRAIGTWRDKVDTFITLTEFSRQKFIDIGLLPGKVVVKPNFLDPIPEPKEGQGNYGLFVGRLSPEKGLKTLLEACRQVPHVPVKVAGDGPMLAWVQDTIQHHDLRQVQLLGRCTSEKVLQLMREARFLIFPSISYETFGQSIIEAFACGLPVIASRMGSMLELVSDQITGLHFSPGDAGDLAHKMSHAWDAHAEIARMGRAARAEFLEKYTAEKNLKQLIHIYDETIARA